MQAPKDPESLTARWLTFALRKGGVIQKASVRSFDARTLSGKKGFLGRLVRLDLAYDLYEQDAPASLIAKFFSDRHEREVRFYRDVATHAGLQTPCCYYSSVDAETGDYVLLLEDLSSALNGDRVAGCSLQEAELAIRHVAKLHAAWWESPKLDDMSWLPDLNVVFDLLALQDLYVQMWQPFLKKVGHHLPEIIREIGARYGRSFIGVSTHLFLTAPRTLIHFDYQLDNLFFTSSDGGTGLTVIDWQLITRGRGVTDVAYFLGQNMQSRDRKLGEMDLLRIYYATLVSNGVQEYTFEQCVRDYRLSMLFWLYAMVITVGGGWFTEKQEAAIVDVLLPRASAAVLDLNAGELLPE